MNLTKKLFNDFKLRNKALSILDGTVAIIGNKVIQTDLSSTVIKELKDPIPEGVYDLKGLKCSVLSKVDEVVNYPIINDIAGKEVISIDTATLLRAAEFCEKNDFTPFRGYIVCINNKLYATNAHKLFHKVVNLPDFSIPAEIVTKFCKGKGRETCEIHIGKEYSKIVFHDLSVIYRNFDGRFPDFESVIPKDYTNVVKFSSKDIAFDKLKFAANQTSKQVRLTFANNSLKIRAEDINLNKEFEQIIPCDCIDVFEIGFNIDYLETCLKGLSNVAMFYRDETRAVLFCENVLLMPVMLTTN